MLRADPRSGAVAPLFAALGDPARAAIIGRLAREGSLSLTDLARGAPISRQAVSRHVGVLSEAGLVHAQKQGRELRLSVRREALDPAAAWLSDISAAWDDTLARLADHVGTQT